MKSQADIDLSEWKCWKMLHQFLSLSLWGNKSLKNTQQKEAAAASQRVLRKSNRLTNEQFWVTLVSKLHLEVLIEAWNLGLSKLASQMATDWSTL